MQFNISITLIQGLVFFYCIIIILYSDLTNNISYFYTLFPQKRYFLIIQKNITILIIDLILMVIGCLKSGLCYYCIQLVFLYWLIGSIILFFFFQFRVAFASSILQLFIYIIFLIWYVASKYVIIEKFNVILILLGIILINFFNVYLYKSKNFAISIYKK